MAPGRNPSSARVRHRIWPLAVAALVVLPAVQARAGSSVNAIARVTSQSGGATTVVRVRGSATPTFTVYKLDRPERVVVDVSNAQLGDGREASGELLRNINSWSVQRVAAHQVDRGSQRAVRIVVSLARPAKYQVVTEGNDLVVKVTARQPAPAGKADPAAHKAALEARREAEHMMKRAAELEKEARELAERAKRDVAQARAQATQVRSKASEQRRAIERRLAEAESMRSAAEKELAEARRARKLAQAERAQAAKSIAMARKARADATEQRSLAEKAARAAELAEKRAQKAARSNHDDAAELEAQAARALAEARAIKQRADRAEALARQRATLAKREKEAVDKRSQQIEQQLAAAETERKRAEAERKLAEAARQQAAEDRARAEQMADKAARRAAELERAAQQAEKRARAAVDIRQREERALAEAARARATAEAQRAEAEKAKQSLQRQLAALRKAESEARARRDAATRAEKDSGNTNDAAAQKAARAAAEAERELAARRQAVAQQRAQLAALDKKRDQAGAELRQLERAADAAREQREAEERRVAELSAARVRAERELAAAKAERARLADESAKAAKVIQAERERADKEVAAARREAVRARQQAEKARAEAEKSREAEAESRAAAKKARLAEAEARKAAEAQQAAEARARQQAAAHRAARPSPTQSRPPRRSRATAYPTTEVASYGSSSGAITQQSVSQLRRRKVYRGRKIDLDFKDADIHNLLRMLADVGGVNIVVPDDIKASVTVRLRDVPWDQAMEVILASKGLWYRREGNLIRVADRKELEAEEEAERARIQAMAQSEAPEPEVYTLNYADAEKINEQLKPLLSPKGRIEVDDRTNALIINDIRAHRRRIIDLVNRLDTQTPQIQIEARIVEARTTFLREFGIQWGGNISASPAGGNATGLIFPNSVGVRGGAEDNQTPLLGVPAPSDFAVNLPAAVGTGAGGAIGMSLGSVGGNVNLNLRLSALEDSGSVRIISAPKITTSNNMQALIKSGVSIPISVISANGVQTQFVPADLALEVTPSVAQGDCSVSMEVNVTKNEADFVNTGARGDPSILTKEARTTILVEDAQTAVIGGIYTRNTGISYSKVPFFGDLPVIGWFFKTRRENDDRSEVLVFITPKITNRANLRCK